jgi:hypothetical protein
MNRRMGEREFACWLVGGLLALMGLLMNGVGYWEAKVVAIKADAWVGVAREIGEGIASLGG